MSRDSSAWSFSSLKCRLENVQPTAGGSRAGGPGAGGQGPGVRGPGPGWQFLRKECDGSLRRLQLLGRGWVSLYLYTVVCSAIVQYEKKIFSLYPQVGRVPGKVPGTPGGPGPEGPRLGVWGRGSGAGGSGPGGPGPGPVEQAVEQDSDGEDGPVYSFPGRCRGGRGRGAWGPEGLGSGPGSDCEGRWPWQVRRRLVYTQEGKTASGHVICHAVTLKRVWCGLFSPCCRSCGAQGDGSDGPAG